MPYCCQCGTQVGAASKFCAKCGAKQAITGQAAPAQPAADWFSGISDRAAALLCYIPGLGWIASVIVIASQRFKRNTPEAREVRFHAFQGLYLFVAWLILGWVVSPALPLAGMATGPAFRPLGAVLPSG